ncbi:MAG: hypothetical protein AAF591_02640 [Verrucomicrobiota bacterium]
MITCREMPRLLPYLLFPILAAAVAPSPATACQICLPIPRNSAADHLLDADAIVLARENPERPFSLKTVEVLAGNPPPEEIDLFVDSATRRLLSLDANRKVVCIYSTKLPDTPWKRVAITNEQIEPVLREILKQPASWKNNPQARAAFFAKYLGHEDPQLNTLAHLEVARAPYGDIAQLGRTLPSENVRAFLSNLRLTEWHALYILLLAQSNAEEDQKRISDSLRSAERFRLSHQLAAWATAAIEVEGKPAIDFINSKYLSNPQRSIDEVAPVLQALATQGSYQPDYRDDIVASFTLALEHHPDQAPLITSNLLDWNRWELAPRIAHLLTTQDTSFDPDFLKMRSYVRQARNQQAAE